MRILFLVLVFLLVTKSVWAIDYDKKLHAGISVVPGILGGPSLHHAALTGLSTTSSLPRL